MQLGDKKLVMQRASVGAKGAGGAQAPVQVQVVILTVLVISPNDKSCDCCTIRHHVVK